MSISRFLLVAILLLITTLYGLFIYRTAFEVQGHTAFTLVDDAMISMRYARNLASGAGLVWNTGEPPIEGFTNLLWVGFMAALHLLHLSASVTSLAVMIAAAIALIANLVVVWCIAREISPHAWLGPTLATLLTGLYFPFVYWSLRGLELGLICFLLNTSILCIVRLHARPTRLIVWTLFACLSLTLMTRPDTLVQVSVLVVASIAMLRRGGRTSAAVLQLSGVLLVGLGLAAFRYLYFGEIFPNTYYLKVTGADVKERMEIGFRMIQEKSGAKVLYLIAVSAGVVFTRDAQLRRAVGLLGVLFLAQTMYAVYVGGDFAEGLVGGEGRFLAQAFGPLILAYSVVVPHFLRIQSRKDGITSPMLLEGAYALLLVGLGSAALISGAEWERWRVENAPMLRSDIERMNLGLVLEQGTRSDAVIAVHAAGNIPYYCNRNVIDLLGKSDRFVARSPAKGAFVPGHNKWDYDYSIGKLRPDIIADGWDPLWHYLKDHPGEYSYLPPNGIFLFSNSRKTIPEILSEEPW